VRPDGLAVVLAGAALFAVLNLAAAVLIRRRIRQRYGTDSPEYRMRVQQDRLVVRFWLVAAPLLAALAFFQYGC
jgi:hypothetical protein